MLCPGGAAFCLPLFTQSGVNGTVDGSVTDEISTVFVKQTVLNLLRRPTTLQEQALDPRVELRVVELVRTAAGLAPVFVVSLHLVWVVKPCGHRCD